MRLFRKVSIFLSFRFEMKMLLVEAFIFLGVARVLKGLPFAKVAPSLGLQMEETDYSMNTDPRVLKQISQALHIMSAYTFWESQCLVKAIAGMKMLERRKVESTLYLGTAKDEEGKLIAHAWLRSGPYYISGAEGMERFSVVGKFAKVIQQNKVLGESNG
ncbi:lasso peptide biosynthesis B2 protein [Bacillus sp. ISL-37]|uniref:lasso peptide biosynthesis B2 protein n=1 Tax=Bacillus sp. ISL-37 TaxID=2819123 RepID=UPI001BEB41F8|nr:lasso peptide biosynthesis B2 protein [Bacillus sp. ISL-37]MBT2686222.1 lasso peptide biosynthesis B2 protein [Bacillus sp. ISL-37]